MLGKAQRTDHLLGEPMMPSVVARGQGKPLAEAEDEQPGWTDSRHVSRAHTTWIESVGACDSLAQGNA